MKKNNLVLLILCLIIVCFVCFISFKPGEHYHIPKKMTISQLDIDKNDMYLYSLFLKDNTSIFSFNIDLDKVNSIDLNVERLDDRKWTSIAGFNSNLNFPVNRILIDFNYHVGGHIAVGCYDNSSRGSVQRNFIESRDFLLSDEYKSINGSTEMDYITDFPYGYDADIKKDKSIILQLYSNGDGSLENEDFIEGYDHPERFDNKTNVIAITARFTKK